MDQEHTPYIIDVSNDDSFDFEFSPPFPHTPSYNGSFHGSPYSAASELSHIAEGDSFTLFDDERPTAYDPSEYDPPNSSSSLLMFTDGGDYTSTYDQNPPVSVSITAPPIDPHSPHSFDYSSPSSNGGGESGNEGENLRSRGSSVSDTRHTSPRLDVAQTFENMTFQSPSWGQKPLPVDRPLSPLHKPQSPPQLRIPGSPNQGTSFLPPPTINAPSGDGGLMAGPQLHIVPATPISGGGAQTQTVAFQPRLEKLRQEGTLQPAPSSWNHHAEQITLTEESQSLGVSQFTDPAAQVPFTYSHDTSSALSGAQLRSNSNNSNDFLFPIPPRLRSKSDTSLQPPQWDTSFMNQDSIANEGSSALDDTSIRTVNMNEVNRPASAEPHSTSFVNVSQPYLSPYNFGTADASNNFLSPDVGIPLRRSKSDGSRPSHQRQSRSEDIRSPSSNLLYPPTSQEDFMAHQYLHPQQEAVRSIRGRHHRSASSGSRGPYGNGGSWSNSSSQRPSPYPSPNPSPRVTYNELPNVPLPGGRHAPILQAADVDSGMGSLMLGEQGPPQGVQRSERMLPGTGAPTVPPTIVSKPNVTTNRTANASQRRRKQDAPFTCTVPGCGSTFTRAFNLKGHMRSHNEEKPFQCHWPGCGKGFARQHDCKRHEQLHTNYRPYTCEGCQKPFARMDALNRHLRSEGGAECQKLVSAAGGMGPFQEQPPPLPVPKSEVDGGWGIVL